MPCKELCIVGLGMIGGSLAAALKGSAYQGRITAFVRSAQTGERGQQLNLIDRWSTEPEELITQADMVMLAVPMLSMRDQLRQIAPFLQDDTIVTDAGSVKAPFIRDAQDVLGSLERVVPGHPIAGREQTGVDASDAQLFRDRRVLLTPLEQTAATATDAVSALWTLTGAHVECLSPDHHDRVLAATSHLPHVLAYALVDTLATQQEVEEIFRYAAGGFRDFTRIASSDPVMWRDVCVTNREAILQSMDQLDQHMRALRDAIEATDARRIEAIFQRAKMARDTHT